MKSIINQYERGNDYSKLSIWYNITFDDEIQTCNGSGMLDYIGDEYIVEDHSQTYAALERLIPGNENPADVILAVKYYDDTLLDAKNGGH